MAEIVLKIGPGSGYEDGDVLCAFNDLFIQTKYAEEICNPWNNGFNEFGTRFVDSVSEDFFKRTHQYKFERISKTEIRRINLKDLTEEIFGPSKIDVQTFIQRRLSERAPDGGPKFAVFGDPESLVWYGGSVDLSQLTIDSVWGDIESKTSFRKADAKDWRLTDTEKKHFLVVPVDNFDEAKSQDLVAPLVIGGIGIKKRKNKVLYASALNLDVSILVKVTDPNQIVDKSEIEDKKLNEIITLKIA